MSEQGSQPASTLLRVIRPEAAGNLPRWLTSFVGRRLELAELGRVVRSAGLVTLTGIGGIGKTRLAVEAAAAAADRFPGGTWFVDVATLTEDPQVPDRLASVLDVRAAAHEDVLVALVRHLRPHRSLVLLDNCEHLVRACAETAAALVHGCPEVTVLATSREALGVPGEVVRSVPPLDVDAPGRGRGRGDAAIRLFEDRAAAALPSFSSEGLGATIAAICRRLEGIPLAIELAAGMTPFLSPVQIEDRLGSQLGLLARGPRIAPRRQQTLRATLDWSHDLLDRQERVLLRRTGVFAGRFTLAAAEEVCAGRDLEAAEVLHLLGNLAAKSLVEADPGLTVAHYRLLQPVREYARERLALAGELDEFRDRHGRRYVRWVVEEVEPGLTGSDQAVWLDLLAGEHDDLREALRWCLASGAAGCGIRLAGGLWRYWYLRGHVNEGRQHLRAALSAAGTAVTPERANALRGAGVLARVQGDFAQARTYHEAALAIHRLLGDRRWIAASLNSLGGIAHMEGDLPGAEALYGGECLEIYRSLGDERGVATCSNNLSAIARARGDAERALELGARSAAIYRRIDFMEGEAAALLNMAMASAQLGRLEEARAGQRRSLALFQRLGYREGIAECIEQAAQLAVVERRDAAAARLFGAAEALRELVATPIAVQTDARDLHRAVEQLRVRMRRRAFESRWAEGRAMSLDDAAELALGLEPERTVLPGSLSSREVEVTRLAAQGLRDREIAERLFLSVRTVEKHMEHARDKLGLQSRAELGAWAAAAGLVGRPPD